MLTPFLREVKQIYKCLPTSELEDTYKPRRIKSINQIFITFYSYFTHNLQE